MKNIKTEFLEWIDNEADDFYSCPSPEVGMFN